MISLEIVLIVIAYVSGSIPFGYLFTKKFAGLNLFELGSGNIGSTNVKRVAGKKVALLTQLCDMTKGLLPVLLVVLLNRFYPELLSPLTLYLVALSSILGHNFSIFLKFRGGKGVNTTLGASVLIAPYSVFISVVVYYIVKWRFRYVSAGSLALAVALPLSYVLLFPMSFTTYYLLLVAVLIIWRHVGNIQRLFQGTENK